MAITERWTKRSGIHIRYLDNTPTDPAGLPMLFVPGLTDFAEDYEQLLEFFAPQRVLVVEVRGRGGSDAPPTGYAVADHVGDQPGTLVDTAALDRYRAAVPTIEIVAIRGAAHDIFRGDRLAYPRAVASFIERRC